MRSDVLLWYQLAVQDVASSSSTNDEWVPVCLPEELPKGERSAAATSMAWCQGTTCNTTLIVWP